MRELTPVLKSDANPLAVPNTIKVSLKNKVIFTLLDTYEQISIAIYAQVLAVLHFYATGSYQAPISCSWLTCLGRSTLGFFIDEVTTALNDPGIQRRWIRFPQTRAQRQRLQAR